MIVGQIFLADVIHVLFAKEHEPVEALVGFASKTPNPPRALEVQANSGVNELEKESTVSKRVWHGEGLISGGRLHATLAA